MRKFSREDAKYAKDLLLKTVSCSEPADQTRSNTLLEPVVFNRISGAGIEIAGALQSTDKRRLH